MCRGGRSSAPAGVELQAEGAAETQARSLFVDLAGCSVRGNFLFVSCEQDDCPEGCASVVCGRDFSYKILFLKSCWRRWGPCVLLAHPLFAESRARFL